MKGIIIDTSSFIEAFFQKVDIIQLLLLQDEPIKPYTTSNVFGELKVLSRIRSERGKAASYSLSLIKSGKVSVLKSTGATDKGIIDLAIKHGFYILSQDVELRKRSRAMGIKVKSLKNGNIIG